jgi:hypothetical protein
MHTFKVDFNELVEPDLVLLSRDDRRLDVLGRWVELHEGLEVSLVEDDIAANGEADRLFAQGVVVRNVSAPAWARATRWMCRINSAGIRHAGEAIRLLHEKIRALAEALLEDRVPIESASTAHRNFHSAEGSAAELVHFMYHFLADQDLMQKDEVYARLQRERLRLLADRVG